jgi:hypothetical protein
LFACYTDTISNSEHVLLPLNSLCFLLCLANIYPTFKTQIKPSSLPESLAGALPAPGWKVPTSAPSSPSVTLPYMEATPSSPLGFEGRVCFSPSVFPVSSTLPGSERLFSFFWETVNAIENRDSVLHEGFKKH